MRKNLFIKSMLCLLLGLVCNVVWAQTGTDGPIVTFTNVQKGGTTYTLYINDEGVLAASTDDASTLGANAQFRATLQDNGKYTFYNESKGLYMIWRNNASAGYDGGDGVMAEYNSTYCDWTLEFERNSERLGHDETFYYITGKRSNGNDGTLILHKNNYFETWSSGIAWHDNYSNLFRIEVVGSIQYTFTDVQSQQQYTGSTESLYPVVVAGGVTLSNKTWEDGNFTADFTYNIPVSDNENTHQVIIGSFNDYNNKYFADGTSVKANRNSAAPLPTNVDAKNYLWTFYPECVDGIFKFKIKNIGTDTYIQSNSATNGHNGTEVSLVEDDADATLFELTPSNQLVNGEGYRLSNGTTTGSEIQFIGTYNTNHNGTKNKIVNAEDYTLTLADGSTFVGNNGVHNLIGGSYTYTDGAWSDNGYSATVNVDFSSLPFPVSSAEATNATMISSFKEGAGGYGPGRFKWYAAGDDVRIKRDALVSKDLLEAYSWAIYPSMINGVFVYSIKSVATDQYIQVTKSFGANSGDNNEGTVILSNTPTWFSVDGNNSLFFYENDRNQYLSLASSSTTDGFLGIHTKTYANGHKGITNSFHTPHYALTSKEELESGAVYTFLTARGWVGATNESENVIATANTTVTPAASTENAMFQWALYQSNNGNYYLYNLGKEMFMGVSSQDQGSIPFAASPMSRDMTFKDNAQATSFPIMFSTDNTHAVSQNTVKGLFAWKGGWNQNDEGSNHQVTYVSRLPEATLQEIAAKVEAYDKVLPITTVVTDLDEDNPNTHFGSVRATSTAGEILIKLKRGGEEVVYLSYDGTKETTIDFTREYRGFEFQGYWVGEEELGKSFTLTEELKSSINDENPLIAKFTATDDVTLFYDDDEFSYRIPAIDTTGTGRIIAVSDYRHNLDDIGRDNHGTGTKRIDLVIRTSDDNGKTWSDTMTIAAGDNTKTGEYLRAFGDAAIATVGENIVVMAAAGDVLYTSATTENPNRMARIFSDDNGETWTHQEMTTKMYLAEGIVPTGVAAFFGSGLLAVDADFNNTKTARIYGALLVRTYIEEAYNNYNNFVVYSDDLGLTWHILGGSQTPVASGDEPKVEILPYGQILLSARRGGGRVFNVFTYTDKASNAGTWSGTANGCNNGGSNSTNGEIFCVDAKKPDGTTVRLLLQSQPKGGSGQYDRKDVTIWYKEIDANTSYTATDIAANWTEGLQVSNQKSAYSTMTMQKDGKVAFFFEEAPCYADNHEKGYSMVYAPLTIETITKGNYFSPNADLNAEVAVNVVLTDAEGNEYRDQLTCALNGIATAVTAKYPFITLGDNTAIEYEGESYTYTNSVTLPFKVSNEDNTVWHNIYYPINTNEGNYPAYMSAAEGSDVVKIVSETAAYGNSTQNTLDNASRISWAIYQSKNDDFSFVLKNQSNGQYLKTTSDAPTGSGGKNVRYASSIDEAAAFIPSTEGHSSNYQGEYSLKVGNGCICVWSVDNGHVTYSQNKSHKGAWAKFVEAPDFAALIDEVNSVLSLFGEGLGEYTPAEADKETLGIAKTAMQNSSSVKLNELNTYKALFTGATLNLPVEGQFFRIKAVEGWNNDAPYLGANNTTVNDKTTRAEFVAEADESTIFYYDGTQLVSYKSRHYLLNNNNFLGYNDVQASGTSIGFRAAAKGTVGAYNISFNSNRYLYTNTNNYTDAAGSTDNQDGYCFNLEEVTSLPVTISSVAYGTLYAPVALAIPEHVKAYTGVIDGDYLVLTKITTGIIPAETGVVLYRDEESYDTAPEGATTHDFSIVANPESSVTSSFSGSVATIAKTSVDGEAYTLQTDTESAIDVAFKPSADDITGGKAYLVLPTQQAARALRIRFAGEEEGGTTSIDEGQWTMDNGQLTIYDLQGRRVLNPTKGMYIVNGKKIVIK